MRFNSDRDQTLAYKRALITAPENSKPSLPETKPRTAWLIPSELFEKFEKETMNKLRQPLPGYDYTRSLTRHSLGIHNNNYHKIRNEVANELSKSRSKDTYNNSRNTVATSLKGRNNNSNSGLASTDGLGRVLFHHTDISQDFSFSQDKPVKTNPVKNNFQIKNKTFFESLINYYSEFSSTDFKKTGLPKRQINKKDQT